MLYILYIKWCAGGCGLHGVTDGNSLYRMCCYLWTSEDKPNVECKPFLTPFDT